MFNNLVESCSHRVELRRRGSFFLFTTASYALLFVIIGVVSIDAYDARLDDQSLEIVTLLPPVLAAPRDPESPPDHPNNPTNNGRRQTFDERREAIAPIDRVEVPPNLISTKPNPDLPVRPDVMTLITGRTRNAELSGGTAGPNTGGLRSVSNANRIITEVEPPPAPERPPVLKVISKGVITGQAISLPKPYYPPMAKMMKIQGVVSVQVLIDEYGNVISAKAVSGNAALVREAEKAALQARFSPTVLSEQPVKVSGTITYNFVLQP